MTYDRKKDFEDPMNKLLGSIAKARKKMYYNVEACYVRNEGIFCDECFEEHFTKGMALIQLIPLPENYECRECGSSNDTKL
jgi:hypothetical protein